MTASGLIAIEKIRIGDKAISTNADTFETKEKTVFKAYIRWTDKLLHLVINGEEIITTETHPLYVTDKYGLNKSKRRILHEEISGKCFGKNKIMRISETLFKSK